MSALTDLQAAVNANTAAIAAVLERRAADAQTIADLQSQIEALKAQITDEAELIAMTTAINAADASLN